MLTEEAIKQTRFFRGVDDKFYMVTEIKPVKIVTLIECLNGKESDLIIGDEVCSQFIPVEADFKNFHVDKPELIHKKIPKEETKYHLHKKPIRARGGKLPSSQFKGVKKLKYGYADGRSRFEASYYNPKTKKVEYLGSFDNEYLAAANYEERVGNLQEAKRLRGLVKEYQDLNPDRHLDGAAKHNIKRAGKTIWVCNRCGLEYESKGTCAKCGNDDMREVND